MEMSTEVRMWFCNPAVRFPLAEGAYVRVCVCPGAVRRDTRCGSVKQAVPSPAVLVMYVHFFKIYVRVTDSAS
jgi:hypothetical protein